jgi:predicted TIM-barrel fold metal-dependent hydrolase
MAQAVDTRDPRSTTDERPLMVFSSDNHVGPRLKEDLRHYCPEQYLSAFDDYANSPLGDAERNRVINEPAYSDAYINGRRRNLETAGHYDAATFVRDMDHEHISGAAIFHQSLNGQPFPLDVSNSFGQGAPSADARELAGVGRSIYNRWLADFCSVAPERMVGLAQLPFWDIDAAIKELEWCADHGLNGVNFPAPGSSGMVQPSDDEMDSFFAAAAALDMTLTTHIGAGPPPPEGLRPGLEQGLTNMSFGLVDSLAWGLRTAYMLCMFGVFEKHPGLKLVITEIPGVSWSAMAKNMDSVHYTPVRSQGREVLPRPPSEYLASNVWLGSSFQSRQEAIDAIDSGAADRFMWGSDYPHPEGTFSYSDDPERAAMTPLALAFTYHDLPHDLVRKMVGENALDAYPRLDGAALDGVAQRVGLPMDEIAVAPDLSQHPFINDTGTLGFRTFGAWA